MIYAWRQLRLSYLGWRLRRASARMAAFNEHPYETATKVMVDVREILENREHRAAYKVDLLQRLVYPDWPPIPVARVSKREDAS